VTAIDFVNGVAIAVGAAVQAAGTAAQSVVQAAANTAAGVVSALWVPLAVVGGAVALFVLWDKGVIGKGLRT